MRLELIYNTEHLIKLFFNFRLFLFPFLLSSFLQNYMYVSEQHRSNHALKSGDFDPLEFQWVGNLWGIYVCSTSPTTSIYTWLHLPKAYGEYSYYFFFFYLFPTPTFYVLLRQRKSQQDSFFGEIEVQNGKNTYNSYRSEKYFFKWFLQSIFFN